MVAGSMREKLIPIALTILRVYVGYVMFRHGYEKLQDIAGFAAQLESMQIPYPQISAYLAVGAEFGGGIALMVGLLTPLAALSIFVAMAVAVFKVHYPNGLMAKNNGFEYPMMIMWVAFFFIFRGAGPISVDQLFCRKKV